MSKAYGIIMTFENVLADYTGASYVVALNSCTNALFLCCKFLNVAIGEDVILPAKTYPSVPCEVIHAGGRVSFEDYSWEGVYQLKPYPIWDAAKRFRKNMYQEFPEDSFVCLSFHGKKILNIGEGGAILTNSKEAVEWFKMARFSGRHEVPLLEDTLGMVGWKMNMTPSQAARGLLLMDFIKDYNPDFVDDDYPDLSIYSMYTKANRRSSNE